MIKILFVCHGNICRSPMAEFVLQDMVNNQGRRTEFVIESAGTSTEEIGNAVHPGTKSVLQSHGIAISSRQAIQMCKKDYETYNYLIGMESRNLTNMLRIVGADPQRKVMRLLDFTTCPRDIADPWYTGKFEQTYEDIREGCQAMLTFLEASRT